MTHRQQSFEIEEWCTLRGTPINAVPKGVSYTVFTSLFLDPRTGVESLLLGSQNNIVVSMLHPPCYVTHLRPLPLGTLDSTSDDGIDIENDLKG